MQVLEAKYIINVKPTREEIWMISSEIQVSAKRVQRWFENRRERNAKEAIRLENLNPQQKNKLKIRLMLKEHFHKSLQQDAGCPSENNVRYLSENLKISREKILMFFRLQRLKCKKNTRIQL